MKNAVLLAVVAILTTSHIQAQHKLIKLWQTDSVFKAPESVLFDGANNILYVSNIDGTDPWANDGKGSIGKLGLDGKPINIEWVKGLNSPKGLAMYNGKLYVADNSNVVVIDIASGEIAETITLQDAQGLNDISIDRNGTIYITDSKTKKVFRIINGKTQIILENLKGPNGILALGNDLYLLDAGGLYRVGSDKKLTLITDGMEGGTDGIENVTGNDFIVSCWQGTIWYINGDGKKELLLDTRDKNSQTADIGYDGKNRIVYVPTFWRNSVAAYEVK